MREVLLGNLILDDSGFIINRAGFYLTQYIHKGTESVFYKLDGHAVYLDELIPDWKLGDQWRRTKYLKSKDMWRAECPGVKTKTLYKTQLEAAMRANQLAEGTDFIPNQIPKEVA